MEKCLNCGKPIPEKKKGQRGRQRLHCDDVCRATYSQKKAQKGVVVPRADIEEALGKPVELKWNGSKLIFGPYNDRDNALTNAARGRDESGVNEDELKRTNRRPKETATAKSYNEILQAAKGGASRAEIDALIAANGGLNAAQKAMIKSKIKN